MKAEKLKIVDKPLFVYRSTKISKSTTENTEPTTDPTTTMITITKTGVFFPKH